MSAKTSAPGSSRWLRGFFALLTLAAILVVTLWEAEQRTSPGPLHPSHEGVAELRDATGCDRCHDPAAEHGLTCLTCHEQVGAQLDDLAGGRGLHAALDADLAADCAACHSEHHGADLALVDDHTFAAAGVVDRAAYDHRRHLSGHPLDGAHESLACEQCHANAEAPALAAGQRRYLGAPTACAECHDDPHEGNFGIDCASCHDQIDEFENSGAVDHSRYPLRGAHAEVDDCARCHQPTTTHSVLSLRDGEHSDPVRSCGVCHDDPHRGGFGANCAGCHDDRSPFAEATGLDHRRFPLDGAHAAVKDCAACHAAGSDHSVAALQSRALSRSPSQPSPASRTCATCHDDPHLAGADPAALPLQPPAANTARDCAACHVTTLFADSTFDAAAHAALGVPLPGRHAAADCAACHLETTPPPQLTDCASCHEHPHREATLLAAAPAGDATSCAACHAADAADFRDDAARCMTPALHVAASEFALVPPHDQLTCADCHTAPEPAPAPGFLERHPGRRADDCRACHGDPHAGQFDARDQPADCLRCHADSHFVPSTFDQRAHDALFELQGSHRAIPCSSCHTPTGETPAATTVRYAGTPNTCAACHADPHGQVFRRVDPTAGADCATCHQPTRFDDLASDRFDHGRWTGFPLEDAHLSTTCVACHGRAAAPDRSGLHPLGRAPRACAACHDDPHLGQFAATAVRGGAAPATDCARCHAPAVDWRLHDFDHARDARFDPGAEHAKVDCAACHRPTTLPDGREVTRYRNLPRDCRGCHAGQPDRRKTW